MYGWRRRRRKLSTEDVAPPALVFGVAGLLNPRGMELRVFDGKQLRVLGRADNGSHNGPVKIKIQKPYNASGQQECDEHGELFLLLHAAVLK
jgi:hypothetical protein